MSKRNRKSPVPSGKERADFEKILERADFATRFKAGNKAAVGRRDGNHRRNILAAAVTDDDYRDAIATMVRLAKAGDVAAFKALCDYSKARPIEEIRQTDTNAEHILEILRGENGSESVPDAPE